MSFPLSKACLWDTTPKGNTISIHLTTAGWIQLKVNTNTIKLAVRHASLQLPWQQEAFLMATPIINKDDSVVLEVNRFDPGKWYDNEHLSPTTILPGDIPLHCKLIKDVTAATSEGHLTHNMSLLHEAFQSSIKVLHLPKVCPFYSLLSLRLLIFVWKDSIQIKCGCVLPSSCLLATPISSIPLLSTSLTRNLTGTLPLSVLQGRVKTGFLTMNETRKLVPLLATDSQAHSVPVVGIWLSDVSLAHPAVWSTALHYIHSKSLKRVTHEGKFLLLITCSSNHDYQLWQCNVDPLKWTWHLSGVETINFSTEFTSSFMMPLMEGVAGHTLLLSASHQWSQDNEFNYLKDDSCPLPVLQVTPNGPPTAVTRDSELSCVSIFSQTHEEEESGEEEEEESEEEKREGEKERLEREEAIEREEEEKEEEVIDHRQHLLALHQQVQDLLSCTPSLTDSHISTTPTPPSMVTIATNTGKSLLDNTPLTCNRSIQADCTSNSLILDSTQHNNRILNSTQHNTNNMMLDSAQPILNSTQPIMSSDFTQANSSIISDSTHTSNMISTQPKNRILDSTHTNSMTSHESSLSLPLSLRTLTNTVSMATTENELPNIVDCSSECSSIDYSNKQAAYLHEIKRQVQELLDSPQYHSYLPSLFPPSHPLTQECKSEMSMLPVPKIRYDVPINKSSSTLSIDSTLDEQWNMADMISQRYIQQHPPHQQPDTLEATLHSNNEYSMASRQYLIKHGLHSVEGKRDDGMILDIPRLKQLSKLL